MDISSSQVISTILKHDRKVTSYKIALLRAINDVVLSYPDLRTFQQDVAVPLRLLAEYWVAYYWAFVNPTNPILQGQRATRGGKIQNDMEFRSVLSEFRREWEQLSQGISCSADGFLIINELRIPRRRTTYPPKLIKAYQAATATISRTIENPIKYAGPGEWTVFEKPASLVTLGDRVVAIPGTQPKERCLVISASLWQTFQAMSLWVEALCIHEWCLFTERITQSQKPINRGVVYSLLTARPDNRRPLTWESNNIDLLLIEGHEFVCPWTGRRIAEGTPYDLDHLLPVSVYPINELWNLLPADPDFNRYTKRDRLPTLERLRQAQPHLEWDYNCYSSSEALARALQEDVSIRFSILQTVTDLSFSKVVAGSVVDLIELIADSRNLSRF